MKGVIFDFNGTLFFDNDKHIQAWNEMSLRLRGQPISKEELHTHLNGVPNHQIIEYFLNKKINQEESKQYSLMKEELYRKACLADLAHFCLVDGVEAYFDKLTSLQIPFTIASASIKENIDFFVTHFHLDKWIDPKTIVYDNGTYENKERMFEDAAHLLNCEVAETIIFEDSYAGIKHAYAAGCREIVVISDEANAKKFESLPGVCKIIPNFSEMSI